MKHLFTLLAFGLCNSLVHAQYISEIDSDQTGSDTQDFVELIGTPGAAMTGLSLVLVNGNNDNTYRCVDLSSYTFPADGVFVVGMTATPNVDLVGLTFSGIQGGADAVVLLNGTCPSNGTACGSIVGTVVSSVVYDSNDADDVGLLACFPGTQINEDKNNASETESIQIATNGTVTVAAPTPGVAPVVVMPPPPPVDPIPTMGQWALFILAMMMSSLALGFMVSSKRTIA